MPNHDDPTEHTPPNLPDAPVPDVSTDRRAALKKLGTLAVYTPPTVVTLVLSQRASAFSEPPPDPTNNPIDFEKYYAPASDPKKD